MILIDKKFLIKKLMILMLINYTVANIIVNSIANKTVLIIFNFNNQ